MRRKLWRDLTIDEKIDRWEHVDLTLKNLTPHEKRQHFDLGDWGSKTECGTVACVAGHCGLNPYFRELGFKLDFKFRPWNRVEASWYDPDNKLPKDQRGDWEIDGDISEDAALFFGGRGYDQIFLGEGVGGNQRVSDCRKAIQRYIKELKQEKADELASNRSNP